MKQHRIARTGQMAAVLGLVLGMGLLAACRSCSGVRYSKGTGRDN